MIIGKIMMIGRRLLIIPSLPAVPTPLLHNTTGGVLAHAGGEHAWFGAQCVTNSQLQ